MDRSLGLYDSDTGESIEADVVQDVASLDEPITLLYAKAKRGRIVQVRRGEDGAVRIHYFYDEPAGQKMIAEDESRNGVNLAAILEMAPTS
jgi:hypothetical protein